MRLIILGMHRSGTSALAGLLERMGAYLGAESELMPPQEANPKGYWERNDVTALNDAILMFADADWSHVARFDPERLRGRLFRGFRDAAKRIVDELEAHRPWAVKDPRFCLLLPFWLDVMPPPICLHIVRRPEEVARSLERRDGIPLDVGAALWEKYNRDALRASRGLPRLSLAYDELLSKPVETTRRLLEQLNGFGVSGLCMPGEEELKSFLDPALNRERRGAPDEAKNENHRRLYETLCGGAAFSDREAENVSADAQRTLEAYDAARATDPQAMRIRKLNYLLEAAREQIKAGEHQSAGCRVADAWRIGWREPSLWRLRSVVLLRGLSGKHTKRALKRTLKELRVLQRNGMQA